MKNFSYIDLHLDLASHLRGSMAPQVDLTSLSQNANIFFGSVFVEPVQGIKQADILNQVREDILWYQNLAKNSETSFFPVKTKQDFLSCLNPHSQKNGVVIHLEGADMITPQNEAVVDEWYELGLRSIGFLWNQDNALGTSAASEKPEAGLTFFGKRIVEKMNKLGILIDCSHINERGFYDILEFSVRPPLVTHGNAYKLCPNPRNFKDAQIKALAERGGIIGVFFSGKYVRQDQSSTIDDVVSHIAHIASLASIDSVAIGSDFGGITSGLVQGLSHMHDIKNLQQKLIIRGFSNEEVEKIFFKNALRYLESALS